MLSLVAPPLLHAMPASDEFELRLQAEFDRARQNLKKFSVVLIEFEDVIDEDAHARQLDLLGRSVRGTDLLGAADLGCFIILMEERSVDAGRVAAEDILERFMGLAQGRIWPRVRVCAGVAAYEECSDSLRSILRRAKTAVRIARKSGDGRIAGIWASGSMAVSDIPDPLH